MNKTLKRSNRLLLAAPVLAILGACSFSPTLSELTPEDEWRYNCTTDAGQKLLYTVRRSGTKATEVDMGAGTFPQIVDYSVDISPNQIVMTTSDGAYSVELERDTSGQPKEGELGKPVPFIRTESGITEEGTCQLKWWDLGKVAASRKEHQSQQRLQNALNISKCESRLKASLNDPDSYQRIEATPGIMTVDFRYRAKNSFGGYVVREWSCQI